MPVRSMTGYATIRQQTSAGELTVSLRAVNHRGLDLHFHLNHEFAAFENELRSLLKQKIARAHVEVRFALVRRAGLEGAVYNRAAVEEYVSWFRQISKDLELDAKPDLNVLMTLPGLLGKPEPGALPEQFGAEIIEASRQCADELNAVREREGEALRAQLEDESEQIERRTAAIAAIETEALPHIRKRLKERLEQLLEGVDISPSRVAEEAAILADKSDIREELTRLTVHTKELRRILNGGGEVGKRLDFLLQEMNRETNTTLAKSAGAGDPGLRITNLGLEIKANIERIREQALNLE